MIVNGAWASRIPQDSLGCYGSVVSISNRNLASGISKYSLANLSRNVDKEFSRAIFKPNHFFEKHPSGSALKRGPRNSKVGLKDRPKRPIFSPSPPRPRGRLRIGNQVKCGVGRADKASHRPLGICAPQIAFIRLARKSTLVTIVALKASYPGGVPQRQKNG